MKIKIRLLKTAPIDDEMVPRGSTKNVNRTIGLDLIARKKAVRVKSRAASEPKEKADDVGSDTSE
ncbi:hypothetical protein [Maritalea sp.]|jgi:hypothetical protein|uniref:hypothetical protein n=1 Tax=Maritalea sp. TaxID=2003361 RepID=UPI0039E3C9B6